MAPQTAGLTLSEQYPQQFRKLMVYFGNDFVNRFPAATSPADKSRVSQLVEAYATRAQDWSGVGRYLDPN